MNHLPQNNDTLVSRMGPRCYGGLVNALGLTVVPKKGRLSAMQIYVPDVYVKKGAAGRSGRVLTVDDKRVCVARKGIMPAASLHSRGPEWMGYLLIRAGLRVRVPSVSSEAVAQLAEHVTHSHHHVCGKLYSRGSECSSSHRDRRLQVRVLPGGKPLVAQQAEHRYSTGFTSNISATPNERDGSKFAGSLRNVGRSPRAVTFQCPSHFIRSVDRPESSGGPNATGYLPSQGSSRSRGAFPVAATCPSDRFRQTSGRTGRMVMVTSLCRAGMRGPAAIVSNTPVRLSFPGGPKSVGYPRFESRRAGKARSSVVRAPDTHNLPTWPFHPWT